jgi:hypothetical protein
VKKAFISYSHHDGDRAARVRDALGAIGWSAFLDSETLPPGTAWRKTLRTELISSDLLIIVLTKAWVDSDFSIAELDNYVKESRRTSKESRSVIPLEFERATDYLIPQLDKHQIVQKAAELSDHALRWVLFCGINNKPPGPREHWAANGSGLTPTVVAIPEPPKSPRLSAAQRLRLESKLSHIQSPQRIREIAWKMFGREVELPEDSKIAWYKLVKMVSEAGLTERLCQATDLDYVRLFGSSGSGEKGEGRPTDKQ